MWIINFSRGFFESSLPLLTFYKFQQFSTVTKFSQAVGKKRFRLPVETDYKKLINYCCGANYFQNGEDIKIKEDHEYPDWLWKLPLVPPKLHELDPNTKKYWEMAEVVGQQREWKLRGITNRRIMIVNPTITKQMELKYLRRFRALAKYHYNIGADIIEHHEREDIWNMHLKEKYRIDDDPRPFYPGLDTVDMSTVIADKIKYRKKVKKMGHFGK